MIKRWAAAIGLALLVWGTSCRHTYQHHQQAAKHEVKRTEWKTAETAESQQHSVATEKKQGSRQTRRWAPDGKLMEEVIEHWGSDGRVQVSVDASASRSAARADFSNVRASSSSARASSTSWWPPWWTYPVLAGVAFVVYAFLRWRARRFRLT